MTDHACDLSSPWPVGHPIPAEDPAKVGGPEVGALCVVTTKYRPGRVVRVLERSYVWSPGECRSGGGNRLYHMAVITDEHGYRVVVDHSALVELRPGMDIQSIDMEEPIA